MAIISVLCNDKRIPKRESAFLWKGGLPLKKLFVLLPVILLTGCSLFMSKPEIAVKGVEIASVNRAGVEMDFLIAVTNPNSYSLKLTGYSYNLSVSALPLAK